MSKSSGRTLLALAALAVVPACSPDAATTTVVIPTSVAVDPLDFLGTVPCGPGAGAAQAYVVTLTDRAAGTALPPSPPVSCAAPVSFENVVVGHTYSADIAVFDVPIATIDASTTPRWTTSCASDGYGAAEVFSDQRSYVKGCTALTGAGTGTTSISVDASALAAPLGCAASTGQGGAGGAGLVDKLSITFIGGAAPKQTIACGQGPVVETTGVVAGQPATLRVEAFAPGATDPGWASTCTAVPREGTVVSASCDPLTDLGYIRIDAAKLVADATSTCGATGQGVVSTFDARFDDPPNVVGVTGAACGTSPTLGPFVRGSHAGEVFLRAPDASLLAHAICFATVVPDATVTATCVLD